MQKKRKRMLLCITIPGILMMITFVFIPLLNGSRIAFFSWNGYSKNMRFVGLENFAALLKDFYLPRTTLNTLIYGIGSCLLQNVLGMLLALFVRNFEDGMRFVQSFICRL